MDPAITEQFSKQFSFQPSAWVLPPTDQIFTTPKWKIPNLDKLKNSLNSCKDQLNNFDLKSWHKHTREVNLSKNVIWTIRKWGNPEMLTQAWLKFFEIVNKFPLLRSGGGSALSSCHLCEAPGAFVSSLNHYLQLHCPDTSVARWKWIATTLNPYYEGHPLSIMINDDRFILHTFENWTFGADDTGNLMSIANLEHLIETSDRLQPITLITADGSVDCQSKPDEQEALVAQLIYCEVMAALYILAPGGCFVVKMFTFFEIETICLMYLLNVSFKTVHVFKPATSRASNSEVYVVCENYLGSNRLANYLNLFKSNYGEKVPFEAMFHKKDIPDDFINQLDDCAKFFSDHQKEAILRNIRLYEYKASLPNEMLRIKDLQHSISNQFIERYQYKPIEAHRQIIGSEKLYNTKFLNTYTRNEDGTYNDRCKRNEMDSNKKFELILNDMLKIDTSWKFDNVKWINLQQQKDHLNNSLKQGRPVTTIFSSKFCCVRLLQLYHEIGLPFRNLLNGNQKSGITDQLSEEIRDQIISVVSLQNSVVVNFENSFWDGLNTNKNHYFERLAINEILKCINNDLPPSRCNLIIEGLPLLTNFTVGLVFLLGQLFDQIGFVEPSETSFVIICKEYKKLKVTAALEYLNTIRVTLTESDKMGWIHSIISIYTICVENFEYYELISKFNNGLLKKSILRIKNLV